jgi:hypothetical protein
MNHAGSLTSLPGAARLTDDGGASATVTPGTAKQFAWIDTGKWATL